MARKQIVYVVTSGEYSDYRINAVFSTKAWAQIYVDKHNAQTSYHDNANIEEWTVDEMQQAKERLMYGVQINIVDGSLVREWTFTEFAAPRGGTQWNNGTIVTAHAPIKALALKRAAEHRQAYLREHPVKVA